MTRVKTRKEVADKRMRRIGCAPDRKIHKFPDDANTVDDKCNCGMFTLLDVHKGIIGIKSRSCHDYT